MVVTIYMAGDESERSGLKILKKSHLSARKRASKRK